MKLKSSLLISNFYLIKRQQIKAKKKKNLQILTNLENYMYEYYYPVAKIKRINIHTKLMLAHATLTEK